MEFSAESLKKLKGTVEKCIADLAKKDDLTPQETKALLDGFQVRDWICEEIEECKMKDEYSERGYSRRMPRNASYGMPMRGYRHYGYSDYPGYPSEHMNASYCDPSDPYYYDGNGNGNGNGGSYSEGQHSMHGRGYSRHSIGDRMVAMMEKEMDRTESDYEKEQLHKFIRMIRAAADEG